MYYNVEIVLYICIFLHKLIFYSIKILLYFENKKTKIYIKAMLFVYWIDIVCILKRYIK
jgi:hypothetical protein